MVPNLALEQLGPVVHTVLVQPLVLLVRRRQGQVLHLVLQVRRILLLVAHQVALVLVTSRYI